MLQCGAVCLSVLKHNAVCCSVLQCVAVCYSVLKHVTACCSALQCIAVRCRVLQCVAVSCKSVAAVCAQRALCWIGQLRVLPCVAVRCSVLQHVAEIVHFHTQCVRNEMPMIVRVARRNSSVLQCDAVCCSALQCVTTFGILFLCAGATASRGSEHD